MNRYQTTETVRLPAGTLIELTDGQAASRAHLLTALQDTQYIAKSPLEFKAGEVIGLPSMPLALAQALVRVDEDGDEQAPS